MDNETLRYAQLNAFDAAMQALDEEYSFLTSSHLLVSHTGAPDNPPNQVLPAPWLAAGMEQQMPGSEVCCKAALGAAAGLWSC